MGDIMDRRREIIASQPHLVTASGSAVLVNIAEPKIERLMVSFLPVQTGSGTPSPSNVRPIMGYATIMASIGTMPVDIGLGGTYYGGTVDLVSGVMTVTMIGFNPATLPSLAKDSATSTAFVLSIRKPNNDLPNRKEGGAFISNRFSTEISSGTPGRMSESGSYFYLILPASELSESTVNGARAWLTDHPTVVAYEPVTPQTVTLTPQTIAALRGQQTVTSPAGTVEISYWTH